MTGLGNNGSPLGGVALGSSFKYVMTFPDPTEITLTVMPDFPTGRFSTSWHSGGSGLIDFLQTTKPIDGRVVARLKVVLLISGRLSTIMSNAFTCASTGRGFLGPHAVERRHVESIAKPEKCFTRILQAILCPIPIITRSFLTQAAVPSTAPPSAPDRRGSRRFPRRCNPARPIARRRPSGLCRGCPCPCRCAACG